MPPSVHRVCFLAITVAMAAASPMSSSTAPDPMARAVKLVAQMTLAEKMTLIQGSNVSHGQGYVGVIPGIERLGVPSLRMNDGPEGFRASKLHPGTSTQWPSGLTVAHSWDVELFAKWGAAMGAEFAGKGANVQFGPGANIARIPHAGRSFEYLSGEDPFLGYTLVQPVVKGIQSQGVIANVKHFLDNNQEGLLPGPPWEPNFGYGDRHSTSEIVDERTQMELYYPPFGGAAEAGVLSVMCANNLVNGEYACQNNFTENTMLKEWGGFKGWVCSDYDGTRSTIQAANGGLDIAMPGPPHRPDYFGKMLTAELARGTVKEAVITDKATRIVYSLAAVGALDTPNTNTSDTDVTSAAHTTLARELAAAACILLKNDKGFLPLSMKSAGSIAVIGDAGNKGAIFGGDGSGKVVPKNSSTSSIFDALLEKSMGSFSVKHATGFDVAAAQSLAEAAKVAIVVLAQSSTEGHDRANITLGQSELVASIASAQPNTLVVTISPGPFLTPWAKQVRAVIDMGMPGEQEGNGLVDVLFGAVNPSGRLPHTLPNIANETKLTPRQYPGVPPDNSSGIPVCSDTPRVEANFTPCAPTEAYYTEKLEIGYRYYQTHALTPAFAFGHGLSYSTFEYSGLKVARQGGSGTVSFSLQNSGKVAGAEVAQLYVTYPSAAAEPFQQLRGFDKIALQPGEKKTVSFTLSDRWLSIWDVKTHGWSLVKGSHKVGVGASSADIRLTGALVVT